MRKLVRLLKSKLKYGKDESVKNLEEEIAILDAYLPEEMTQEEVEKVIDVVFTSVKPTSMKDMGMVMKSVNEALADKNADMSLVSKLVKEKLSKM